MAQELSNSSNKHERTQEDIDRERAYWQHVNDSARKEKPKQLNEFMHNLQRTDRKPPSKRKQVCDYDTGKLLFHRIAMTLTPKKTYMEVQKGKGKQPVKTFKTFVYNEHNLAILPNLVKWFIADPSCEYDLDKGIGLLGGVGIGKTHLFDIFREMVKSFNDPRHYFRTDDCTKIHHDLRMGYNFSAPKRKIDTFYAGNAFFDELGKDELRVEIKKGYEVSPMEEIIFDRHRRWKLTGEPITHFASNLDPDQLKMRYKDRAFDRLKEHVTMIYIAQDFSWR
jgi:predicted ATPase